MCDYDDTSLPGLHFLGLTVLSPLFVWFHENGPCREFNNFDFNFNLFPRIILQETVLSLSESFTDGFVTAGNQGSRPSVWVLKVVMP